MRAGKENGLLLPSVNGTAGHVLTSQGDGNVVWSPTNASGLVTLTTTQNISGQKTFGASQTNFGASGTTTLNTTGNQLILQMVGGGSGSARLILANTFPNNGVIIEQLGVPQKVDLIFSANGGQSNIRYERRPGSFQEGGTTFELQIGSADDPELVVANNGVVVRSDLDLRVGTNNVYHQGNIPGTNNQVIHKSATGISAASNVEIENGYLRFPVGLPTSSGSNGVVIGGRSIAGRFFPAFVGPSGLDSSVQPLVARNKVGWFNPPGNATTVQTLGMNVSATGTATAANIATTNIHTAIRRLEYAVTVAATNAVAGIRSTALQYHIGDTNTPYGGFTFIARFGPSRGVVSNTTRRFWAGMTSQTGGPSDTNPSTWANNGIGVGTDSTDANFQIMHRNGTGTMTKINTGISKAYADSTEMFELALFTAPTGSASVGVLFTRLSDNQTFSTTITTNLPSVTQLLTWQIWNSVGGTSSVVGMSIASVYIETDF